MRVPTAEGSVERVAEHLRAAILQGNLLPGMPLRETQLAKEFDVSRTPVRQALRVLQDEGLVQIHLNRGAFVNVWNRRDLLEVAEVRAHLSVLAARHAAHRMTEEELEALSARAITVQTRIAERADVPAKAISDVLIEFHSTIFAYSGNALLARLFAATTYVQVVATTFRHYDDRDWERIRRYVDELVMALRSRDGELASALMSAYFRQTKRAINAFFAGEATTQDPRDTPETRGT